MLLAPLTPLAGGRGEGGHADLLGLLAVLRGAARSCGSERSVGSTHGARTLTLTGAVCVLAACSSTEGYRIEVGVPGGWGRAVAVDVALIGDCGEVQSLGDEPSSPFRAVRLEDDESHPLGGAPPGEYGLYGRAWEIGCALFAAGCTPVRLEAGGEGALRLELVPVEPRDCDEGHACVADRCVASPEPDGGDASVCGDGVRQADEECDDGNESDEDGCVAGCLWARCGDGLVRRFVEGCDDGNDVHDDACDRHCRACAMGLERIVLEETGHCYATFEEDATWDIARLLCHEQKAHLVTYSSPAELLEVPRALGPFGDGYYWIGLADRGSEGTWYWDTDEPVTLTRWAPGLPDGMDSENCAVQIAEGQWDDMNCDVGRPHICEDEGWRIRPVDNHAYRAVYEELDWIGAAGACDELGGHLVTIVDEEENHFATDLLAPEFWIGLSDVEDPGSYAWVTGEEFEYSAWDAEGSQPDGGSEHCVRQVEGGLWHDGPCAGRHRYICEID